MYLKNNEHLFLLNVFCLYYNNKKGHPIPIFLLVMSIFISIIYSFVRKFKMKQ